MGGYRSGGEAATIIETKVICREPGRELGQVSEYYLNEHGHPKVRTSVVEEDRYLGWPTIACTREGELLVAYSGDRDSHVCPWGRTHLIRSRDEGRTWSQPEVVNNTPLDDRDAGIIQTRTGALVVSWFTSLAFATPAPGPEWASYGAAKRYARHSAKISQETRETWLGNWTRRSEDCGKTWQEPVRTLSTAPHGPIQLRDGRLLYVGNDRTCDPPAVRVEQSSDDGRSWSLIASMPAGVSGRGGMYEPHVAELASGRLLAMFRCQPQNREEWFLTQSESDDGGKTWTPFHRTPIWGFPPHLIPLRNGWVLVVYGHRREPFGERACISRDEGGTWDVEHEIVLTSAPGPDLGYPSSAQLEDGSILTVYYQAERSGEPTRLMSTHWRLA